MGFVGRGARQGIAECQWQFRNRRWNCSTVQDSTVFGPILSIGKSHLLRFFLFYIQTSTSFLCNLGYSEIKYICNTYTSQHRCNTAPSLMELFFRNERSEMKLLHGKGVTSLFFIARVTQICIRVFPEQTDEHTKNRQTHFTRRWLKACLEVNLINSIQKSTSKYPLQFNM